MFAPNRVYARSPFWITKDCSARYVRPRLDARPWRSLPFSISRCCTTTCSTGGCPPAQSGTLTAVLRSALAHAVRWSLILENPRNHVDLPRQNGRRVRVLSVEQARTFIKAITGHGYEALFELAITTGMRPSEYLALTWNDVDFDSMPTRALRGSPLRVGGNGGRPVSTTASPPILWPPVKADAGAPYEERGRDNAVGTKPYPGQRIRLRGRRPPRTCPHRGATLLEIWNTPRDILQ